MRRLMLAMAVVFAFGLLSDPSRLQQQRGGEDETGPYELVPNWPQPIARPGYALGSQGGVFAESPDRVFLVNRGEIKLPEKLPNNFSGAFGAIGSALTPKPEMINCILIIDANGKLVESWTQWDKLFEGGRGPHKVKISPYDPERHVWVIDDLRQQIFKFTRDGKRLVMTLGEAGVAGTDEKHFGRPTDIAWLPDGTFFISDGYTNTRVMKFDANGKFLMQWGTPGTGNSQFNTVHAIDIDRDRKVYVSDRGNGRIQIFDENGKYPRSVRRPAPAAARDDHRRRQYRHHRRQQQQGRQVRPQGPDDHLVGHAGHIPRRDLEPASVLSGYRGEPLHRRGDRRAHAEVPAAPRRRSVEADRAATGAHTAGDELI